MNTFLNRFVLAGFLAVCALFFFSPIVRAAVTTDALGWTVITPSSDSIIVYVSNAGSDSNDGLTPATAKATIAGANALMRDGYPDHMRLRRGDTFVSNLAVGSARQWKSGRSAAEPIVMESYGSTGARPVIKISSNFINHDGALRNYQAFIGLDIYKSNSDPASPDFTNVSCDLAMRFVGGGDKILVEDCRFRFCGVVVQSYRNFVYTNFAFYRNIVTDTWAHLSSTSDSGKIQGMYVSGVNGYRIEENFYDHNGWSVVVAGAGAHRLNHNLYISANNFAGGVIRGNIFARGAAHGMQARSGGVFNRNLFVLNAVGFNTGYTDGPADPNVLTFANSAVDNVILNGRSMGADTNLPRTGAVWGIWKQPTIPNMVLDTNIVANRVGTIGNFAAMPGVANLLNNIIYLWEPARNMTNPSWPHPGDDLGDFYASTGGSNSTIAYLNALRDRPTRTFPWNMTAYAAINYIRAGFNKPPVTGLFNYSVSNLLAYGGFEPDAATTFGDMPTTYTLGTGPLNKWQARVGVGGQSSTYLVESGNHYIRAGSGNTPGTFQAILYPGAGSKVLTYSYRGAATVRVYTGAAGNTISKFTGATNLTLVQSFTNTPQATWTPASHNVTLSGSPSYVVIQLRGGDFDDISFASP